MMNTEAIVAAIETYTSSYNSFINSTNITDRDNAEFFRLAAITMREVRLKVIEGEQLVPEEAIGWYRGACTEYLATGRLFEDSSETMVVARNAHRREYADEMRRIADAQVEPVADGKKPARKKPVVPDPVVESMPVARVPAMADPDIVEMVAERMMSIIS